MLNKICLFELYIPAKLDNYIQKMYVDVNKTLQLTLLSMEQISSFYI